MTLPEQGGDNQDDLIKFVNDPETIKRAAEGSMEKRLRVMAQSNEQRGEELRARVLLKMTALALNFRDLVSDDMPSLQESTNDMVQLILADRKQHELDAEIRALEFAWDSTDLMVKERIAELKAEREAL